MKKLVILVGLLVMSFGCSDKALDVSNKNDLTTENFYKTESDALKATNAAYSALASPNLYGRMMHAAQDMMSDETELTLAASPEWMALREFETDASNEVITAIWTGAYQGIYRANLALERIPGIPMDENLKKRLLGEARFLRGLYYFILATNYGDVPLIQKVVNVENNSERQPKRTPIAEVYEAILTDFAEAEKVLPTSYTGNDIGRVTQGAAKGFRAKALLYRGNLTESKADYARAAALFKEIIDSKVYDLMPDYHDNFTEAAENNRESLFEVQFSTTVDPGAFCDECGTGSLRALEFGVRGRAYNRIIPSLNLVAKFEPTDKRLLATVFGPQGSLFDGQDYYLTLQYANWGRIRPADYAARKFQKDSGNEFAWTTGSGINFRLMRFADVLLMYAEAQLEAQGVNDAVVAAVNRIRRRAGVAEVATVTQESLRLERLLELGLEGHRWRDLIRWKIAEETLLDQGRPFNRKKDYLFAIPANELKLNPNLTQNPGWNF
ncbi:RagB/SusD family nutrient uptake outer membrane protein [Tellurirhabdus bombi]|uniref:RagB/SusD family nutrient uptake outer membrane protein n=1 Tax=Tellurirhabdus bombi TaxID=2907205 RepID=UPI001F423CF2|nr:RagB/SusD family nutrient uptake outer membrane protein [Tellurirhabdus bombi]